jgi:4a-hydroxytetrahydrobiopterin dehydratase
MRDTAINLALKNCRDTQSAPQALSEQDIELQLREFSGWERIGDQLTKKFSFDNYHQTMAFVNATAWISHRQDHHPDLKVGYNTVEVFYSTHSAGGLTEFDFICAAKIEQLFSL